MASDWSFGAGQGAFRPNASGALQDGQSFGSYKITGTLGQGAHGVVRQPVAVFGAVEHKGLPATFVRTILTLSRIALGKL